MSLKHKTKRKSQFSEIEIYTAKNEVGFKVAQMKLVMHVTYQKISLDMFTVQKLTKYLLGA